MTYTVSYRDTKLEFELDDEATVEELMMLIQQETAVATDVQKLIVPKVGAVRDDSGSHLLTELIPEASRSKMMLVGVPTTDLDALKQADEDNATRREALQRRLEYQRKHARKPARTTTRPVEYGFGQLVPLYHLPNPVKSLEYLQRIQDDKAVQALMAKYKWQVGTLTELDPKTSNTESGRLLGLNENKGQTIRLRLRTDDYDGYCQYKQVIKVLCHELAHNVHGEHDRQFWDLTNKLEKQVIELDPFGGKGHRISEQEIFDPELSLGTGHAESLAVDHGTVAQEHVLGSSSNDSSSSTASSNSTESVRDKMFKAAQQRKKTK